MSILITGNRSGLGKYLFRKMGDYGIDKDTPERERVMRCGADVIIHCAFNPIRSLDTANLMEYVEDNVMLTRELTGAPHRFFILISSIDVYPKDGKSHQEDEVLPVGELRSLYPAAKLISEAMVRRDCPNYLILRCAALLGSDARKNSLTSMLSGRDCSINLARDSRFNYILHQDVGDFIRYALQHSLFGIYNMAASESVTLGEVADILGKQVRFGSYRYDAGNPGTGKILKIFPSLNKTSWDNIKIYLKDISGER
jgi:nucleoside-diphosphate-sugar epimerase